MPIAGPYRALGVSQGGGGYQVPMRPVGLPAMVLAPRTFAAVGQQMPASYAMVNAELRPAQPREERLGLIGASAVFASELDTVVDPHHREAGVQNVPGRAFVSMDGCSGCNVLPDRGDCIAFAPDNPCLRAAATLA